MNFKSSQSVARLGVAEDFVAKRAQEKVPELSVVVPCFNEVETVNELVRRATAAARSTFGDYELILVDVHEDVSFRRRCLS
jgi:hypothetical protein